MKGMQPVTKEQDRAPAALYSRHYMDLVRLAVQFVDDIESAEDVVQEVFAAWPAGSHPDEPLRYLRTAVVNRARSALRRRRTARALRPPRVAHAEPADAPVVRSERSRALLAHIDTLPRRQREIVVLRYYLDLPNTEIATMLGIRPSAVSTSLSRALATLKAHLSGDSHGL